MHSKTGGELLSEEYLVTQDINAEHEPSHSHTSRRPDFVINHRVGKLIVEIKDIYVAPPRGGGVLDMYGPIRTHIHAAREQFKPFKNHICILVLTAAEGSFIDLSNPTSVLGAMYGSVGFSLPFDPELGRFDSSQITREFMIGDGKMVRRTHNQHTRISAILTLHHYDIQSMRYSRLAKSPEGRAALIDDSISFPEEKGIGVTVWQNGVASNPYLGTFFADHSISGGRSKATDKNSHSLVIDYENFASRRKAGWSKSNSGCPIFATVLSSLRWVLCNRTVTLSLSTREP